MSKYLVYVWNVFEAKEPIILGLFDSENEAFEKENEFEDDSRNDGSWETEVVKID